MDSLDILRGDIPAEVIREGVLFPWMVSERAVKAVRDFDVRDDDVWITTYPKSGTHWTVEITNLVLNDGIEENIDRTKQPDPIEFDMDQPGSNLPPNFPPEERVPFFEKAASFASPRVFMTHVHEHMMPRKIYEGTGKVIIVLRNPKDLAVSMWHYLRGSKLNPKHESWDTFFDMFCSGEVRYGSWFTFNLAFWNKHHRDKNFLFLKYEDMKKDLRGAVVKISDFLGKNLADDAIERVVNKSTVDSMKERFNTCEKPTGKIGAPSLIRKGIVGDWESQFTVAQNERFDKLYLEKMQGCDLKMDFEIKKL